MITDRYFKLAKVILTALTTVTAVATILVDNWISNFSIPSNMITYNGLLLPSKFFQAICAEIRVAPMTTTRNYPQTNVHLERYNAAIVSDADIMAPSKSKI